MTPAEYINDQAKKLQFLLEHEQLHSSMQWDLIGSLRGELKEAHEVLNLCKLSLLEANRNGYTRGFETMQAINSILKETK